MDRARREMIDEPWFLVVLVGVIIGLLAVVSCVVIGILYQRHANRDRKTSKQPVLDGRSILEFRISILYMVSLVFWHIWCYRQTLIWVGSIHGLGWVRCYYFILLCTSKNHRLKWTITLHQQKMVHGHAVKWIVISPNQTSYRGCKRDRSRQTSCHITACSLCSNLLYYTVFDLYRQHVQRIGL